MSKKKLFKFKGPHENKFLSGSFKTNKQEITSMDFNELLDKLDNLDEKNLKKAKESLGGITKEKDGLFTLRKKDDLRKSASETSWVHQKEL